MHPASFLYSLFPSIPSQFLCLCKYCSLSGMLYFLVYLETPIYFLIPRLASFICELLFVSPVYLVRAIFEHFILCYTCLYIFPHQTEGRDYILFIFVLLVSRAMVGTSEWMNKFLSIDVFLSSLCLMPLWTELVVKVWFFFCYSKWPHIDPKSTSFQQNET